MKKLNDLKKRTQKFLNRKHAPKPMQFADNAGVAQAIMSKVMNGKRSDMKLSTYEIWCDELDRVGADK